MKSTFIVLIVIIQVMAVQASDGISIAWQKLPPMPQALSGHMSVWRDGELLVIGGTNWKGGSKSTFAGVWGYSPKRQNWQQKTSLPQPIAYGVAKSTFTGLTVYGGWDDGKTLQTTYSLYENNQWKQGYDLPLEIAYGAAEVVQDNVYLIGGATDLADATSYNSFVWKRNANNWVKISSLPKPCALVASASTLKGFYLFGGMNMQNGKMHNLSDAWFYDSKKNKWKTLQHLPIAARGMAACVISERYIVLAGGYSDTFLNQVLLYDIKNNSYSSLTSFPYAASGMQMVYANHRIYVTGGEDAPRHRSNALFVGQVKNLS